MKKRFISVHVVVFFVLAAALATAQIPQSDDSGITVKIKTKFAEDEMLKASPIRVETRQGIVRLRGIVDSQTAMDRAFFMAQGVEGVKSVRNELRMKNGSR